MLRASSRSVNLYMTCCKIVNQPYDCGGGHRPAVKFCIQIAKGLDASWQARALAAIWHSNFLFSLFRPPAAPALAQHCTQHCAGATAARANAGGCSRATRHKQLATAHSCQLQHQQTASSLFSFYNSHLATVSMRATPHASPRIVHMTHTDHPSAGTAPCLSG